MIEQIEAFEFVCKPMQGELSPIRSMTVIIYAKNKSDADEIFFRHAHQYFDQNLNVITRSLGSGYKQVDK